MKITLYKMRVIVNKSMLNRQTKVRYIEHTFSTKNILELWRSILCCIILYASYNLSWFWRFFNMKSYVDILLHYQKIMHHHYIKVSSESTVKAHAMNNWREGLVYIMCLPWDIPVIRYMTNIFARKCMFGGI